MSIEIKNKIKFLYAAWPKNAVLTSSSLKSKGFSDQLVQKYNDSGWVRRIGTGAFVRQNDKPIWEGGLYAIQHDLKKNIHIGGLTALVLAGLAHYLDMAEEGLIYLYNTSSQKTDLPKWFAECFNKKSRFLYKQCHLFNKEIGLRKQTVEGLEIVISEPERAILELLYFVPKIISVEHAVKLIENLQTIYPDKMQSLLESCRHILVKRLFLCLADLCQLPVMKYLQEKKISLGSGDRTINRGGKYFSKYKLVLSYNDQDQFEEESDV